MKIQAFTPRDPTIRGFIERYLLVESPEHVEMKTIPNGRVDASIVLEGELEWFFKGSKKFTALSPGTFYPLTRTTGRVRSRGHLRCVGIKFYPHVLVFPVFENKKLREPLAFEKFFKTPSLNNLTKELKKTGNSDHLAQVLDAYFLKHFFSQTTADHWIREVTRFLELGGPMQVKIGKIAENMGVNIKTLERRFQKTIGLTPKLFSSIIQLHQTTRSIRKKNPVISHGDLTEALGNGYYDQSHFIKSCRRITGLTPKKLFTHLPGQMTDLVIVNR